MSQKGSRKVMFTGVSIAKWVKTSKNGGCGYRIRVRVYINMRERKREEEKKGIKTELNLINYYIKHK